MARALSDLPRTPVRGTEMNLTMITASVAIGTAGAVDSTVTGYRVPAGITVANTGTGTFSLVYPACPNAVISVFIEKSGAATVTEAILTAKAQASGTGTIRTSKAGTATNPASGDIIGIVIHGIPTSLVS